MAPAWIKQEKINSNKWRVYLDMRTAYVWQGSLVQEVNSKCIGACDADTRISISYLPRNHHNTQLASRTALALNIFSEKQTWHGVIHLNSQIFELVDDRFGINSPCAIPWPHYVSHILRIWLDNISLYCLSFNIFNKDSLLILIIIDLWLILHCKTSISNLQTSFPVIPCVGFQIVFNNYLRKSS